MTGSLRSRREEAEISGQWPNGVNASAIALFARQPITMLRDEMVAMLFWSLRNLVTIPEGTNVGTVWISTWVAQAFCKRLTPEASGPAGRVR